MAYKKLTYSGTKCNNYIYLSFDGDYFDTALITKKLEIEPTSVRLKTEPIPKSTSWKYEIDLGSKIVFETPLENLIELFESKIEKIVKLNEDLNLESRLQFVVDIDINPEASTPFFPLSKKTISFLNKTGTVVDFDLYKTDTIGILNRE